MSHKLESPVETQMVMAVFSGSVLSSECHRNQRMDSKHAGRRRVFVQTDTGSVLGIELDRGDSAHTVKRKMQLALHMPTDESSLTFGDRVLNNDLSYVRNDSALRLTRNGMHRSSSTPCLTPTNKDLQQKDRSGPIEVLCTSVKCSRTKELVKDVVKAIKNGVDPTPVQNGLGGAYYFRNTKGENVAIVKPTDEEPFAPNNPKGFIGKALGQPGLKRSVRVGETGFREVAAYLLDHDNFASVPPTVLVKITHSVFCINQGVSSQRVLNRSDVSKIASFQQYIHHDFDASDHGTSSFPVSAIHRIGILDVRIMNTDRHAGNLLVRKLDSVGCFGQVELIPIDHGLCLPEDLEDPYFEWLHWPQASIPFSEDELQYITNLDPFKDADMLRIELPMIREACLRVLILCTVFLKEAAAFGLCLAEIGGMMSREVHGMQEEPSELELVCIEAKRLLVEEQSFLETEVDELEPDHSSDDFQFEMDDLNHNHVKPSLKVEGVSVGKPDLKLDEFFSKPHRPSLCVNSGLKSFATLISPRGGGNSKTPGILSPRSSGNCGHFSLRGGSCRNPLSKLDECAEEGSEKEEDLDELPYIEVKGKEKEKEKVYQLSKSFKNFGMNEQYQMGPKVDGFASGSTRRSAEEQAQVGVNFVKLSDMADDEWWAFLLKFQDLLLGAFEARKGYPSQKQRLGTSCQF